MASTSKKSVFFYASVIPSESETVGAKEHNDEASEDFETKREMDSATVEERIMTIRALVGYYRKNGLEEYQAHVRRMEWEKAKDMETEALQALGDQSQTVWPELSDMLSRKLPLPRVWLGSCVSEFGSGDISRGDAISLCRNLDRYFGHVWAACMAIALHNRPGATNTRPATIPLLTKVVDHWRGDFQLGPQSLAQPEGGRSEPCSRSSALIWKPTAPIDSAECPTFLGMWTVDKTDDPDRGGRLAQQIASAVRHLIFAWKGIPTLVRVLYLDGHDFNLERVDSDDLSGWKNVMEYQIGALLSKWGFERRTQWIWRPPARPNKATLLALTLDSPTFGATKQAIGQALSHVNLSFSELTTDILFSNSTSQVRALLRHAGLKCSDRQVAGIIDMAATPHCGQNVEQVIASALISKVCIELCQRIEDDGMMLSEALAADGNVTEQVQQELLSLVEDGGQLVLHVPPAYWLRLILMRRLRNWQVPDWTNDLSEEEWGDICLTANGKQISCQGRWCQNERRIENVEGVNELLSALGMEELNIGTAESHVFVFHGTACLHVPSVLSRVRIDTNSCDYNFGSGFYTNDNFNHCVHWSRLRARVEGNIPAVVGFAIPREEWNELARLDFRLNENAIHWESAVNDSRDHCPPPYFMNYDIIEGQILGNNNGVLHQIVFRTHRGARMLDNSRKFFVLLDDIHV